MPRPRIKFRLSTLFWITLAVATFFAGIRFERERRRREDEAAAPKKMSLRQWLSSSGAPATPDARKSSMSKNGIDADGSDPGEGTGAR